MDDRFVTVRVKCPDCGHSLMNPRLLVDALPSIDLEAKVREKLGHVFLSQIYGSYEKQLSGVDDVPGSIAAFSCPHCHEPFPMVGTCECRAPMVALRLEIGGVVKFCSRNGCKKHALEFEDVDQLFELFESQSVPG